MHFGLLLPLSAMRSQLEFWFGTGPFGMVEIHAKKHNTLQQILELDLCPLVINPEEIWLSIHFFKRCL